MDILRHNHALRADVTKQIPRAECLKDGVCHTSDVPWSGRALYCNWMNTQRPAAELKGLTQTPIPPGLSGSRTEMCVSRSLEA